MSKATVKVDRDAMLALLSTAYRSCRQLGQISAALHQCANGELKADHGWLYETADLLDTAGHNAMIKAARLLGVDDEDQLARFRDCHEIDADAAAGVWSSGRPPLRRRATG